MKEYQGIPVSSFSTYRNNQQVDVDAVDPIYCVVSLESIISHCLLVPYKKSLCFMLEIIHPNQWPDEFLEIP